MKKIFLLSVLSLLSFTSLFSQSNRRVLFIGNSYIYSNNLPLILKNIASSRGYSLITYQSTPGGSTLQNHSANATTINLINQGNWDFVVLQEQSQLPSFPIGQVQSSVYPYAAQLNNLITAADSCAETVFFMTWGRQNGDASNCTSWPPICTYQGMDSLLSLRYQYMAAQNQALVSPVGAVWNYIRNQHPSINLYSSGGSHPALSGTYAAALTFYTIFYRSNPQFPMYSPNLPALEVSQIRNAVKAVVYDSLSKWNVGLYDMNGNFNYSVQGNQVQFNALSLSKGTFTWDFGDGTASNLENPLHTYMQSGTYTVKLHHAHCGSYDSTTQAVNILINSLSDNEERLVEIQVFPNPSQGFVSLKQESLYYTQYAVYDLNGRLHKTGNIQTALSELDLSQLANGIYSIQLANESKLKQLPLLIQK